jgi:hypothetical protein
MLDLPVKHIPQKYVPAEEKGRRKKEELAAGYGEGSEVGPLLVARALPLCCCAALQVLC